MCFITDAMKGNYQNSNYTHINSILSIRLNVFTLYTAGDSVPETMLRVDLVISMNEFTLYIYSQFIPRNHIWCKFLIMSIYHK